MVLEEEGKVAHPAVNFQREAIGVEEVTEAS
jgi:hypothetical protein